MNMKILETTIKGVKRYVGKNCSFNYDGTVVDMKVGIISFMIINIQKIVNNGPERLVTVFTDFGIVKLRKKDYM